MDGINSTKGPIVMFLDILECQQKKLVKKRVGQEHDFNICIGLYQGSSTLFLERYHPSEQDDNMLAMAEDDVDLPKELLKMVDEDASGEEDKDSILGGIQNLQNQLEQLKEKASTTMTEMKTKAEEKCFSVM
uniref:Uncharacterized protein n=1 Tax=Oncorhynchus tshawytscha TaxID=74940 RepID=A0AAZ3R8F5_ONCTS